MGSNQLKAMTFNDNDILTIKSSSSNSMIESATNRGNYVEKSSLSCGKSSEKSGKVGAKLNAHQAEVKADALIRAFDAPYCREFFLKCVYHLTEHEISKALYCANKPHVASPVKYFNKTCKQMLERRGL